MWKNIYTNIHIIHEYDYRYTNTYMHDLDYFKIGHFTIAEFIYRNTIWIFIHLPMRTASTRGHIE